MIYSEIHVWGDSIARGIVYDERRGRYAIAPLRYPDILQKAFDVKLNDHSVMGQTVVKGLESFLGTSPVQGALCAIEYGGNDCDLNWAEVAMNPSFPLQAKVSLENFGRYLGLFVDEVRNRGMHPLMVTPPPLHAARYFAWVTRNLNQEAVTQALGEVQAIYRWQERYTIVVRRVAEMHSVPLLDVRDAFLACDDFESLMCVDGIHPNEDGHRLIAKTVLDAAQKGNHFHVQKVACALPC